MQRRTPFPWQHPCFTLVPRGQHRSCLGSVGTRGGSAWSGDECGRQLGLSGHPPAQWGCATMLGLGTLSSCLGSPHPALPVSPNSVPTPLLQSHSLYPFDSVLCFLQISLPVQEPPYNTHSTLLWSPNLRWPITSSHQRPVSLTIPNT